MKKDHMEILLEDIHGKLELLVEGHGSVVDGLYRLENRMDGLENRMTRQELLSAARHEELTSKIQHVADDLAAHRTDTEVHSGYQVRERPTEN